MVFDSDAHVEENTEIFAALEGREEFIKSTPCISEGPNRAFWIVEGKIFLKLTDKGVFIISTSRRGASTLEKMGRGFSEVEP